MNEYNINKEEILEELNFSKNEAKVYLCLLENGPSSVTDISTKTKVNRTNIYDCISRLIERGIVSYFKKAETKIFEAADPELLHNILKEKELKLNTIMPELKLKSMMAEKSSEAHIFEGIVAVRNMLNHFLDLNEPRYSYGAPILASKMLGDFFLENYHRRRIQKKLSFQMIYNSDAKKRIDYLNSLELTEARFLKKEYDSPVTTSICGNEVVIFLYGEKPLVIQIKNSQISKAYKKYFDLLWTLADTNFK
ncbi:MAG: TrmB family transcriptional regulator [Candidatus Woesearchaeota archaeon]